MNDSIAGALRAHPLRIPELRLGLVAWATFILATCAYCLLHQAFVSAVTPDPAQTFTLALREWGAWALLAPIAMKWFRVRSSWRDTLHRGLLLAAGAATLPIAADLVTGDRSFLASIALFWPRNIAMTAAMLLIARVFTRNDTPVAASAPAPASTPPAPPPSAKLTGTDTLLVSKGADQCLIRIDDIQHLSAAGNYVEISVKGQRYLLRATFGEIEASLPPGHFARIHRSHIVRVCEIERIRVGRSGSGRVHLRGGAALAISRAYRAKLKSRLEGSKIPLN